MKQYKAEAGLELSNKIVFASQIVPGEPDVPSEKILEHALKTTSAENKQPDLYYFKSILTSIGINKNDDYFDAGETWAARHTPEDKQINYEHNERDIIGHMTGCYAVSADLSEVLEDSLTIDELPSKFHIVTPGVLYQRWEDSKLQARMDDIISDIAKGDLFVSMECLFNDFDYILLDEEDSTKAEIVSRNQQTAFLTKYLRGFGGTGVYKSRRIGRLLKNIIFSGKGIVKKPANPESIILAEASEIKIGDTKIMAKELETSAEVTKLPGVDELNATIKSLKASLDEAKQEKDNAKAEAIKDAKAKQEKEFNDMKAALATKDAEIKSLNEQLAKADESLKSAATEIEAAKASAKAAQDELATIAADNKTAKRIAKLVDAGKTKEDAAILEKTLATLDDAAFEAIATMLGTDKKPVEATKAEDEGEAAADPAVLTGLQAQRGVANVVKTADADGDLMAQFQKSIGKELKLCRKFQVKSE